MKNGITIYGFIDESGAPGVANNDNDYLIVSVMMFKAESEIKRLEESFIELKKTLSLKRNYEFHYAHNSPKVKGKVFAKLSMLDFEFMTFAIKKNDMKKQASYNNMAEMIIKELAEIHKNKKIIMDTNPTLYKELNKMKKIQKVKNLYFRQANSKDVDGLQAVDYIVSSHSRIIKGGEEPGFKKIARKMSLLKILAEQKSPRE